MAKYKSYSYSQNVLIPVSLEEQLVPGTLEFAIHTLVETRINTSIFDHRYGNDETGRLAYDPKILLKIVLFGYSRGLIYSRQIERACKENVTFMALACGEQPDHSTIADFVSSMKEEIKSIFRDVLLICEEEGLLGGTFFALDGCKLASNASKEWSGTIRDLRWKKEKIEKLNSELASLVSINPLKASEIQTLLDGETALIEYFVGMESRFIFLVTQEKVLAVPLGADPEKLFQKIREFRIRAVEGITLDGLVMKTYEKSLSELYEMLIQPIEREISGKKRLVIVPQGMLHYLPFQALLSKEGKYLLESFSISYLPSASVLKYARGKNKGNRVDLFAVGNPITDLPPLPAAEQEAQEISALFEKKLLLTGRQATKTSMKSQSPKYDLLHLSTHGEMIELNPLKSNLRFTPSERDDGKLTVSEIFDMGIKANLVTLSACETGLVRGEGGDFPQGDDLVGLSRAFIHAGAPAVIASLWKVSDDSTVELMRAFYRNLKSMSKSEALRKAQLDLMKSSIRFHVERGSGGITQSINYQQDMLIECSHPYFWAPFILLGDWR